MTRDSVGLIYVYQELETEYEGLRHTRADGNCFYRAYCFALFEYLRIDQKEYQK